MISIPVYEPKVVDGHGDPVDGGELLGTLENCDVYPTGSTETAFRTSSVIDGITVLCPSMIDGITPQHEIEYLGKRYKIVGEIGIWRYLDGTAAGCQINASRGQG